MKRRTPTIVVTVVWLCGLQLCAYGIAEHFYKPNEYDVIDHGLSPNKAYAVAAHGGPDGNPDDLHLYLMDARNHQRIGPLEEVHGFDTAPEAFLAQWSADSRHVAISNRVDRHINTLLIYRIENRRAFPVTGPALIGAAAPHFDAAGFDITSNFTKLEWLTPSRFVLRNIAYFRNVTAQATQALGRFGKVDSSSPDIAEFSIEAVCGLTDHDEYSILTIKPGAFED